jgi:hypothetical protein
LQFANHIFGKLQICGPNFFFANLELPKIRNYIIFLLTKISFKKLCFKLKTTFGFWESSETQLHDISLSKMTYVVKKKILEANQMGSGSETLLFSLQIFGFAICGLGHQGILQSDLQIIHNKIADSS